MRHSALARPPSASLERARLEGVGAAQEEVRAELQRHRPAVELEGDENMGLTEDYIAFRDRYRAWRQDEGQQAHEEAPSRGFGYWYPTQEVWSWRRTLSYWIAVCFFEGSIFFTVSSFLLCYPEALGPYKRHVTSYGYVAGKIHYIIGTYLMCIETINLNATELHSKVQGVSTSNVNEPSHCNMSSPCVDAKHLRGPMLPLEQSEGTAGSESGKPRFHSCPFRYKKALNNLERLGAGPWPYYASVVYFVGVLIFTLGLVAEFLPMSEDAEYWLGNIGYTLGSAFFVAAGIAECIECEVFVSLKLDAAWWGALLNTLGGVGFFIASFLGFFPEWWYVSAFVQGVGSALFVAGSGLVIVMWKDEQFGLTFLAAINNLGGENRRPVVLQAAHGQLEEVHTFSIRGAIFVMIYCLAGAVSTYNFFTALVQIESMPSATLGWEAAFNALLPCIFAHLLLGVNAAVVETPKRAPFHQLYIGCRWLALVMIASGTANLVETLATANQ